MAMRVLLILHRYLGVVVGLVMTLWCLSGFVMMYQGYPDLTEAERLRALPRLAGAAWAVDRLPVAPATRIEGFRIEAVGDRPVLRLRAVNEAPADYDLLTGERLAVTPRLARAAADAYGRGLGLGAPAAFERIEVDQWSVGAGANRHQPLYRAKFDDAAVTWIYVSGRTGEVLQDASQRERVLGWLGAVPHWLYPTLLRQNAEAWSQAVVWSSILGLFLTLTGIYVGVARFRRYKSGRWSPYRGLFSWHHYVGLAFGLLTLTWVFSGLLTMGPWDVLGRPPAVSRTDLAGDAPWAEVAPAIGRMQATAAGAEAVEIQSAFLAGEVYAVVATARGAKTRLDAAGRPRRLGEAEVAAGLARLGEPRALKLINEEDAYYYAHKGEVPLPVYRAEAAGGAMIYVDAVTGSAVRIIGADQKTRRWLENGLHSFDFAPIRARPVWDLIVLPLLAGVTLVCATGAWMAVRRVRRDLSGLRLLRRSNARP